MHLPQWGPKRPHRHKDPTFWFEGPKQGIPERMMCCRIFTLLWSLGPLQGSCTFVLRQPRHPTPMAMRSHMKRLQKMQTWLGPTAAIYCTCHHNPQDPTLSTNSVSIQADCHHAETNGDCPVGATRDSQCRVGLTRVPRLTVGPHLVQIQAPKATDIHQNMKP